eukprot:TRINITY_DN30391_c0_g1_i1.p1 TRINITY_DN30391_c0_g1~~TRINITY_DN30391_c0_g1_i1.p1  ORF type:complete len:513 (+),score=107.72 TRINITY_DN30391_c0_g1_i1:61-1599(+)
MAAKQSASPRAEDSGARPAQGGCIESSRVFWRVVPTLLALNLITGVVNLIEGPFARSLVSCDVPLAPAGELSDGVAAGPLSGSLLCGDRLEVLGQGSRLISFSGSQVSLLSALAIPLQVGISELSGRRSAFLLGTALLLASCGLYALGAVLPAWGPLLYIVGNNLQAFQTLAVLDEVVITDVIRTSSEESSLTFGRFQFLQSIVLVTARALSAGVKYLELQTYAFVWRVIFLLVLAVLLYTALFLPETRVATASNAGSDGTSAQKHSSEVAVDSCSAAALWTRLRRELADYHFIFSGSPERRWRLVYRILKSFAFNVYWVTAETMMAHFGYTQRQAVVYGLCMMAVPIAGFALGPRLLRRVGHERGLWMFVGLRTLNILGPQFLCTMHWSGFWVDGIVRGLFLAPEIPIRSALDLAAVPPELAAKWQATSGFTTKIVSSLGMLLYSSVFDARATSYLGKAAPVLLSMFFEALTVIVVVTKLMPMDKKAFRAMDENALSAKAQVGETERKKEE